MSVDELMSVFLTSTFGYDKMPRNKVICLNSLSVILLDPEITLRKFDNFGRGILNWKILVSISMISFNLVAEGDNSLDIVLDNHLPKLLHCFVLGTLSSNDKSKWFLLILNTLFECGLNEASINIRVIVEPFNSLLSVFVTYYDGSLPVWSHI